MPQQVKYARKSLCRTDCRTDRSGSGWRSTVASSMPWSVPAKRPMRADRVLGAVWPWWKINDYTFGFGRTLLAIDPQTSRVLWSRRETDRIDGRAVCLKSGHIYYYCDGKFLACLDTSNGELIWK